LVVHLPPLDVGSTPTLHPHYRLCNPTVPVGRFAHRSNCPGRTGRCYRRRFHITYTPKSSSAAQVQTLGTKPNHYQSSRASPAESQPTFQRSPGLRRLYKPTDSEVPSTRKHRHHRPKRTCRHYLLCSITPTRSTRVRESNVPGLVCHRGLNLTSQ